MKTIHENTSRLIRRAVVASGAAALAAAAVTIGNVARAAAGQAAGRGTIAGHVRLAGQSPGNAVIRMRMDPGCTKATAGRRMLQEQVVTSRDGGLANVFVRLQGSFPPAPVPAEPVRVDQHDCVFHPRVAGARVGQTLAIRNSDDLLHNAHSDSDGTNSFNVGQPVAGMVHHVTLKAQSDMLRLTCDVHRWMIAYVGIVPHPYFAVTGDGGSFTIPNVPAGAQTVQIWHERYGMLTQTVRVRAGATVAADFVYPGDQKAGTAGLDELTVREAAGRTVWLSVAEASILR